MSSKFTYYFESFSNIVFVSSSVSGLIFTFFKTSIRVAVSTATNVKTWVNTEADAYYSGSRVTQSASSVPGLFCILLAFSRSFVFSPQTSRHLVSVFT